MGVVDSLGHNFKTKHQNFAVHSDKDKLSRLFVRFFFMEINSSKQGVKAEQKPSHITACHLFQENTLLKIFLLHLLSKYRNMIKILE